MELTLSVIKADIGGYVGHSSSHPEVLDKAEKNMAAAKKSGLLIDYHVTRCGDDLQWLFVKCCGNSFEMVRTPRASFSSRPLHSSSHKRCV